MWNKSLWLTLPLLAALFWASYTWHQTTNAGPFSYFRSKYPELTEKQLLEVANSDIYQFAKAQKDISNITKFMESIGFKTKVLQGELLKRSTMGENTKFYYVYEYRYGYFGKSHKWSFAILIYNNDSLRVLNSFQVCTSCP